jgi:predicted RecB family endonuclease
MTVPIKIIKADGTTEDFSADKVISSLRRAGADQNTAESVVEQIKPYLYQYIPSFEIYKKVMSLLKTSRKDLAERYDLKKAVMELGPTGYPFEKFFAEVLRVGGYETLTNQLVMGHCVKHEVDIVAKKEKEKFMIECKFHNQPGVRTDIKVALYVYARFLDVKREGFTQPWLVTNTKATQEVIAYAGCVGMRVTSWDYPVDESLREMIDQSGLHPITSAVGLSLKQKQSLLEQGIVFCKDMKGCLVKF